MVITDAQYSNCHINTKAKYKVLFNPVTVIS